MNENDDVVPAGGSGGGLPATYSPSQTPDLDTWQVPEIETADYGGEVSNQPAMFGVPLPAGITEQQTAQIIGQMVDGFQSAMLSQHVQQSAISHAIHWFQNNFAAPPQQQHANHRYNLAGFKVPPNDEPYLVSFLNYAASAGISEKDVKVILRWVANPSVQSQPQRQTNLSERQIEARAESDRINGDNTLRQHWGYAYANNLRLVKKFFASLPASEREKWETHILPSGMHILNDPTAIVWLHDRAIQAAGGPLPNGAGIQKELDEIQNLMKNDRKAYNRNEALQARYRQLIELRDGR